MSQTALDSNLPVAATSPEHQRPSADAATPTVRTSTGAALARDEAEHDGVSTKLALASPLVSLVEPPTSAEAAGTGERAASVASAPASPARNSAEAPVCEASTPSANPAPADADHLLKGANAAAVGATGSSCSSPVPDPAPLITAAAPAEAECDADAAGVDGCGAPQPGESRVDDAAQRRGEAADESLPAMCRPSHEREAEADTGSPSRKRSRSPPTAECFTPVASAAQQPPACECGQE